jgi:hypothetical protein
MKVAPEHMHPEVLRRMRKPAGDFPAFMDKFFELSEEAGKEQYLVPVFHLELPRVHREGDGCGRAVPQGREMEPTAGAGFHPVAHDGSAAMYVTGLDINTGKPIPVVRGAGDRERQKRMLRPNPVNEVRQTGSRRESRGSGAVSMAEDSLDRVD